MMLDALRLYRHYISISIRGQLAYRASFIMQTLGTLLVTGIEFVTIMALFDRFGSFHGWSLPQVALLYGMVNVAFALTDATSRGFDRLGQIMIKTGDFDRLLLRPRSTVLQLAGQELTLRRIGRLLQGLVILIWAMHALGVALDPARLALLVAAILGGACMFYGLLVLQATAAFWTTESLEVFNAFTYGGVFAAQYPISAYSSWFRKLFTYVIPLATVNYYPALAIMQRPDPTGAHPLFHWCAPALGVIFLLVTLYIWKIGERHYCSTGS